MRSGKEILNLFKRVRTICIILTGVFLISGMTSFSWAGNKEMVEDAVQDLDELNKQAVSQIPDIPKDGKVYLKANVTYDEKGSPVFDIYHKEISSPVQEKEIHLDNNQGIINSEKGRVKKNGSKND
jgi:hypothetical protein